MDYSCLQGKPYEQSVSGGPTIWYCRPVNESPDQTSFEVPILPKGTELKDVQIKMEDDTVYTHGVIIQVKSV